MKAKSSGAKPETITDPEHIIMFSLPQIERWKNGRWEVTLKVSGDVQIGDGRTIQFDRIVKFSELQTGRKPREEERKIRKRKKPS